MQLVTASTSLSQRRLLSESASSPPEAVEAPGKSSNGAVKAAYAASQAAPASVQNSSNSSSSSASKVDVELVAEPELVYKAPGIGEKFWTNFKLSFALPWRRFKHDSVLVLKLEGNIAEQPQGRFSNTVSLPAVCDCLLKAAYDPRVTGVVVKIDPLGCGWGKLQELRRHIELFNESGKMSIAYMERAGEKEYYLASAFKEVYMPPSGSLSLRGFTVGGTFLRGVFDKVGVQPEVKRFGKYKSAGDQLLRTDMSEAQREQLTALLDDIYDDFLTTIARSRGKTREEVAAMLDAGIFDMEQFKEGGWLTDLKYEDEINDMLKPKTGGKEDEVAKVSYNKYAKVRPSTFGAPLSGSKAIAVIRASGAIVGGKGTGNSITAPDIIRQLRAVKKNKKVAAVVLRVDSGGGDALASDLMWREISQLAAVKPVIASMSDVAASGGYYMSMAANKIVAEALTVTGSIGVVTGKFNLKELYDKVGYSKELISKGRYAQLFAESKSLSEDEEQLFDASALHAYESFRNKAAESRGMDQDAMQDVAQGRVWSGQRAVKLGLVDAVGGIRKAIALAKQAAGIAQEEGVRLVELSRAKASPLSLLPGLGASASSPAAAFGSLVLQLLAGSGFSSPAASILGPIVLNSVLQEKLGAAAADLGQQVQGGLSASAQAVMPDGVEVQGVGSSMLAGVDALQQQVMLQSFSSGPLGGFSSGSGGLFD
ncbi:hypothetical protein N2152v2_011214 [Parachlorella kessleri]